jgi:uncharacterized protein involved in type VI secretion and phage assembly
MPFEIYRSDREERRRGGTSTIAVGVVSGNCDLIMQGKVLVRLPALGMEVWARQAAPGAGSGRGLMSLPKARDEVLVAFNQEDPNDAYILGGLWSNTNRVPASLPTDTQTRVVLRTGETSAAGHEVTFDDLQQSITIETSLGQTITMSPQGVEIVSGSNKVKLGPPVPGLASLQLEAPGSKIAMDPSGITIDTSLTLTIKAATINITGTATVKIGGAMVMIN